MAQWCTGGEIAQMTAHANSLTKRVTTPVPRTSPPLTMPAADLRVFLNGLVRLGYSMERMLSAAGLDRAEVTTPDARVPCDAFVTVLTQAQQERFCPNLALELARATDLGAWPLLDYLVLTTDTVGAAVHQLARYFRLHDEPVVINVCEEVEPIRVGMTGVSPFAIEFEAALIILRLRQETDGAFAAAISFQHAPDDPAAFERIIGCPVTANALWSGITIDGETWRRPLRRRDPVLRQMLEERAQEILARLPARTGLAREVQRALTPRVAGGDTRIGAVARQLAMSARTLQRRLEAEGVSYQALLDDARKEAAGQYVSESTLAISEIAYLLGYSEAASFHRAFKRWYGVTPESSRSERLRR
jgi:AraC-like DNA-binding protein